MSAIRIAGVVLLFLFVYMIGAPAALIAAGCPPRLSGFYVFQWIPAALVGATIAAITVHWMRRLILAIVLELSLAMANVAAYTLSEWLDGNDIVNRYWFAFVLAANALLAWAFILFAKHERLSRAPASS